MIDFIIVGAQKAATTYIQAVLSAHKGIFIPKGEIPVFEDISDIKLQEKELQKFFLKTHDNSLLGIKRPNYLPNPEAAYRIYKFNPNARIIVLLRKPEKRAIAAYFHYMKYGFTELLDADLGLNLILENKHPQAVSTDILTYGLYASQLKIYFDLFGAQNVHVGIQERLLNNPLDETKRLFKFLNLEPLDSLPSVGRPQAVVYNFKRLKFITSLNYLVYKYNQDKTRLRFRKFGLPTAKIIELFDQHCLKKIFQSNDVRLSEQTMGRLEDYYKADKAELYALLNDSIPEWV